MISPQIINIGRDSVMAFIGYDVINNTTQIPISEESVTSLFVDVRLYNLITGSNDVVEKITMTFQDIGFWTININDIIGILNDRSKYVGKISKNSDETADLRTFYIPEFVIDNDSFEDVLMRMPYEIIIAEGSAYFYWYEVGHQSDPLYIRYVAPAYEGGSGTNYATDPSRVTHRGEITEYLV
jgi:hypothetical protein